MRAYTEGKPYVCTGCTKSVAKIKVHTGEKLYSAPSVQSFMDEIFAERNIKSFPGKKITGSTYESSHWGKTLQLLKVYIVICYQFSLLKLYRVHTGRKPYSSTFQSHLPMKVVYKNM